VWRAQDTVLQELRKQYQVISELRSEIKSLQSDNLKLYEKVRYMQSYREEAATRPPTSQLDPLPVPSGSARGDDMSKYRARYEESMNPFEVFRGRVRLSLVMSTSTLKCSLNIRKQPGLTMLSIPSRGAYLSLLGRYWATVGHEHFSSFMQHHYTCWSCSLYMNV
jgi:hypothetical protein